MQHFIGCDVHTRDQVVAWIEEETGEIKKRRLEHEGEEVKEFYAQFPRGTVVGIEATFPAYWFERLMGELGHELWVGDAARIRASEVRYQKTDSRDAELHSGFAAHRPLPAHLGSLPGRARPAAVAGASDEAGAGADAGEEPVARPGDQPGGVPEGQAVECEGKERTREPRSVALGGAAAERVAGVAGPPGRAGAGTGPGGGRSRPGARGGGAVAHPSGSGHGGVAWPSC